MIPFCWERQADFVSCRIDRYFERACVGIEMLEITSHSGSCLHCSIFKSYCSLVPRRGIGSKPQAFHCSFRFGLLYGLPPYTSNASTNASLPHTIWLQYNSSACWRCHVMLEPASSGASSPQPRHVQHLECTHLAYTQPPLPLPPKPPHLPAQAPSIKTKSPTSTPWPPHGGTRKAQADSSTS